MSIIRISGTPSTTEGILAEISKLRDEQNVLFTLLEEIALGKKLPHVELQSFLEFEAKKRGYTLAHLTVKSREKPLVSIRHEIIFAAIQRRFSRTLLARYFQVDRTVIRYIEQKFRGTLKRKLKCQVTNKSSLESPVINTQVKIPSVPCYATHSHPLSKSIDLPLQTL